MHSLSDVYVTPGAIKSVCCMSQCNLILLDTGAREACAKVRDEFTVAKWFLPVC